MDIHLLGVPESGSPSVTACTPFWDSERLHHGEMAVKSGWWTRLRGLDRKPATGVPPDAPSGTVKEFQGELRALSWKTAGGKRRYRAPSAGPLARKPARHARLGRQLQKWVSKSLASCSQAARVVPIRSRIGGRSSAMAPRLSSRTACPVRARITLQTVGVCLFVASAALRAVSAVAGSMSSRNRIESTVSASRV